MNRKKLKQIGIILLPFLALSFLIICKPIVKFIAKILPKCPSNKILHILCPGCGITRSILALINGNILTSLRNNALCLILVISITLVYLELLFKAFDCPKYFFPRNKIFLITTSVLIFTYLVTRNFVSWLAPISSLSDF